MGKQVALGSILEWDVAGGATFTPVGCTPAIKPPDSETEDVEAICLTDTMDVPEAGIDAQGEATFDVFLDPADAVHKALFDARVSRADAAWRLLTPHKGFDPATVVDTFEWTGRIRAFQIQELTPDGMYRATIVIRLTTQVVMNTHTIPGP